MATIETPPPSSGPRGEGLVKRRLSKKVKAEIEGEFWTPKVKRERFEGAENPNNQGEGPAKVAKKEEGKGINLLTCGCAETIGDALANATDRRTLLAACRATQIRAAKHELPQTHVVSALDEDIEKDDLDVEGKTVNFSTKVQLWVRQCLDFHEAGKSWSPGRPCCFPNALLMPKTDVRGRGVACYNRLSFEDKLMFKRWIENGEADQVVKDLPYLHNLMYPELAPKHPAQSIVDTVIRFVTEPEAFSWGIRPMLDEDIDIKLIQSEGKWDPPSSELYVPDLRNREEAILARELAAEAAEAPIDVDLDLDADVDGGKGEGEGVVSGRVERRRLPSVDVGDKPEGGSKEGKGEEKDDKQEKQRQERDGGRTAGAIGVGTGEVEDDACKKSAKPKVGSRQERQDAHAKKPEMLQAAKVLNGGANAPKPGVLTKVNIPGKAPYACGLSNIGWRDSMGAWRVRFWDAGKELEFLFHAHHYLQKETQPQHQHDDDGDEEEAAAAGAKDGGGRGAKKGGKKQEKQGKKGGSGGGNAAGGGKRGGEGAVNSKHGTCKTYDEAVNAALQDAIAKRTELIKQGILKPSECKKTHMRSDVAGVFWSGGAWGVEFRSKRFQKRVRASFKPKDLSPEEIAKARELAEAKRRQWEGEEGYVVKTTKGRTQQEMHSFDTRGQPGLSWSASMQRLRVMVTVENKNIQAYLRLISSSEKDIQSLIPRGVRLRDMLLEVYKEHPEVSNKEIIAEAKKRCGELPAGRS